MFVRSRNARAFLLSVSSLALLAGEASAQNVITLDPVTVLATKTEEKTADALAAVSSVRPEQLEQLMPSKPSDILFGIPGVWFQERADDPGTAVNIRGLQDFGRVAVVVDGARQNFQTSGHNADGVFYLDPDLVSGADVIRGPVANIYGSGAIGGVVSFNTKDVDDVLRPGEHWGILSRGEIGSNKLQGSGSTFAAFRPNPNFDFIVGGVVRSKSDYRDGDGNEIQNSHSDDWSGLAKATFRPADGHQVKLGFINYNAKYDIGQDPSSIYATAVNNQIATARWTYARPDDRLFDFDGSAYWTHTGSEQTKIAGAGSTISGNIGDTRDFNIDTIGFDLHNTTRFDTGPIHHALTYGGDGFRDKVETGGFGTIFTPSGERTVSGAFVQLKSTWSILEVIGAARYDHYHLEGGGTEAESDRVSPKLTVGITPLPGVTPYFTYAEGYRAPAVTETLISGIHPVAFADFEFLPNPALRPEVGKSKEVGLNLHFDDVLQAGDKLRAKANVFRNDVDGYIEQVALFTGDTGAGGVTCTNVILFGPPDCFQYQNISKARLEGFEFESSYDAGDWFAAFAYSHVRGTKADTGQPLAKVAPDWAATTLGVRLLERKLTLAVRWQAVAAKKADDIPASSGTPEFPSTDSYNLVNVYAGYQINPDILASFSIENLLNEQYAKYLTYYPGATSSAPATAFPQPGITFKGALTIRFGESFYGKG